MKTIFLILATVFVVNPPSVVIEVPEINSPFNFYQKSETPAYAANQDLLSETGNNTVAENKEETAAKNNIRITTVGIFEMINPLD